MIQKAYTEKNNIKLERKLKNNEPYSPVGAQKCRFWVKTMFLGCYTGYVWFDFATKTFFCAKEGNQGWIRIDLLWEIGGTELVVKLLSR